jgi:hypothetical protein
MALKLRPHVALDSEIKWVSKIDTPKEEHSKVVDTPL